MKKFIVTILTAALLLLSVAGLTSCDSGDTGKISVYMPDGAPALAMAKLMKDDMQFDRNVSYTVVDASVIQTYVTGESPAADLCILPVNAASKILGTGKSYKMLGTVTHGNLFILAKKGADKITAENLSSLVGKTVGVINLPAVPGLTLKLILNDNNISYSEIGNTGAIDGNKVNLKSVDAAQVIPSGSDCDYFIVSEPAATTKVNATKGALEIAGNLQELYNADGGYPQAVLVAKNQTIENDGKFISDFVSALSENASWIIDENTSAQDIVSAVESHLAKGLSPKFTEANLNKTVIRNCAINFVKSSDCKEEVNAFIAKLITVSANSASTVNDNFYYTDL